MLAPVLPELEEELLEDELEEELEELELEEDELELDEELEDEELDDDELLLEVEAGAITAIESDIWLLLEAVQLEVAVPAALTASVEPAPPELD